MSPFVSGALGAVAVLFTLAVLRHLAWRHRFRHGYGRGHGTPLRWLFRRLGTRPDQERVISAEADALASELRAARGELHSVRDELAALVAAPALDAAAVRQAIDARLERLGAARTRLAEGIARIHETLDAGQREALAAMIRRGGHHHGRCAHGHGRC